MRVWRLPPQPQPPPHHRWTRRGVIASFGLGFTLPYFSLLNEVEVEGDEILDGLPRKNVVFLANHQTYFLEAIGFRDLLLHKRFPGKLFRNCSIRLHRPLPLDAFYAEPYSKESGAEVLRQLEERIGDGE